MDSNGYTLKGTLQVPDRGLPCIVMLHGFTAHKDLEFWREIADRFTEENFTCLRFNFRGCGNGEEKSQGNFEDTTLTSRIEDYQSTLDFLKNSDKINPSKIGAFGHSLGGMVAISAMDDRVSSIVTMGTPYQIPRFGEPELPKKVGDYYELPSGIRFKKKFYEDMKKYDMGEDIQKAPPIKIIQGKADDTVPLNHARKLYRKAKKPKSLEIVPKADHLFSNKTSLKKALDISIDWFNEYLKE